MSSLTLDHVIDILAAQVARVLDNQLVEARGGDAGADAPVGAYINPNFGVADAGSTAMLAASCGYLFLASAGQCPQAEMWLERARLGVDYLLRVQRANGLIDLITCNYDSAPDTGFAVQRLCPLIELGRPLARRDQNWAALLSRLEIFVRRAVPGLLSGGFHTPNHRWVIASALAQAGQLFTNLKVRPGIDAYLAEGFDVDAEGAFIERSIAVYDAVNDRSLLLLYDLLGIETARQAAEANLEFNLYLLNADGTAETGLSRRQDYGTKKTPTSLTAPYLHCAHVAGRPQFVRAAQFLWDRTSLPGTDALNWLCYVLLKYGDPALAGAPALPTAYARHFPLNGVWRARRGDASLTLFTRTTRLLDLSYGQAELSSVKISQSYFGMGRFVGDALTVSNGVALLRSDGQRGLHRPGYDLPLGRRVPNSRWREAAAERDYRPLPPCASTLAVQVIDDGFSLHYRTVEGLDGVTAQMALDFPPGGVWETDELCLKPQAGQVLFLKRGYGTMRYGNDVIRVGPGADAHRMWQMRDAETAPDHVRVLLTFTTPIDHVVTLQTFHRVPCMSCHSKRASLSTLDPLD